jgi:hypothetical protein
MASWIASPTSPQLQEPELFASSIRHNIMQGFPDATKEDFQKARLLSRREVVEVGIAWSWQAVASCETGHTYGMDIYII